MVMIGLNAIPSKLTTRPHVDESSANLRNGLYFKCRSLTENAVQLPV